MALLVAGRHACKEVLRHARVIDDVRRKDIAIARLAQVKEIARKFLSPNPSFEVTVFFWNTCYKEFRLFVACGYGYRRK